MPCCTTTNRRYDHGGIGDSRVDLVDQRLRLAACGRRDLAREHVLVGEVVVEAALGDGRRLDDLVHADAVDVAMREQAAPRVQQRVARAIAARVGPGCATL